jgi:hypothetical protein
VQLLGRAADALQGQHRVQGDEQIEVEFVKPHWNLFVDLGLTHIVLIKLI